MRGTRTLRAALLAMLMLFSAVVSAGAYQLTPGGAVIAEDSSVSKASPMGAPIAFTAEDLCSGNEKEVFFLELPADSAGSLQYDGREVLLYEKLPLSKADRLCFVPAESFCGEVQLVCRADDSPARIILLSFGQKPDLAPTASDLTISTLRDISCFGLFDTSDSEGPTTVELISKPKQGTVTLSADGMGFIYTPTAGKTGSDKFQYAAVDSYGNRSETATVRVRVEKPVSDLRYADLAGNYAELAAVRLAERDILTGENLAGENFFTPTAAVPRGDFFVMAMKAVGRLPVDTENASLTGDRAVWTSNYVATASASGLIAGDDHGALRVSEDITRGEAAVMLSRLLNLEEAGADPGFADETPAWAADSVAKLHQAGILLGYEDGTFRADHIMTRAEAAQMLMRAMDYAEAQTASVFSLLF